MAIGDLMTTMRRSVSGTFKSALRAAGYDVRRYAPKKEPRDWLGSLQFRTVFDVGANAGQFAKKIRLQYPDAWLYSFEPLSDAYEALVTSRAGDAKFRAFNCALSDVEGTAEFHRSAFSPSSSLRPMAERHRAAFPHTAAETIEKVKTRRLDAIVASELRDLPIEGPILLKIDVQGGEDVVVRGGEQLVRRAAVVLVETSFVPLYEGQPLFDDVHALLRSYGMSYAGNLHQMLDPRDGAILQADAIFVPRTRP